MGLAMANKDGDGPNRGGGGPDVAQNAKKWFFGQNDV